MTMINKKFENVKINQCETKIVLMFFILFIKWMQNSLPALVPALEDAKEDALALAWALALAEEPLPDDLLCLKIEKRSLRLLT